MISILIPTFNRKHELPRAIRSVLAQTYQDFEIIVVDDGSKDATETLFASGGEFALPNIRYDVFTENKGVHQARNRAIDLSNGKYIVLLDSDDELVPEALEKAMAVLEADETLSMVSAPYKTEDGELTSLDRTESGLIPFEDILCEKTTRRYKEGFMCLRRDAVGDIRWKVPYLMFLFFRQVLKNGKNYFIAEPLGIYHYLFQPQSVSRMRRKPNSALSIQRARALDEFLQEFGERIIARCPKNYSWHAYGAAVGLLLDGQRQKARTYAKCAMVYSAYKRQYSAFYILTCLPGAPWLLRQLFAVKQRAMLSLEKRRSPNTSSE